MREEVVSGPKLLGGLAVVAREALPVDPRRVPNNQVEGRLEPRGERIADDPRPDAVDSPRFEIGQLLEKRLR